MLKNCSKDQRSRAHLRTTRAATQGSQAAPLPFPRVATGSRGRNFQPWGVWWCPTQKREIDMNEKKQPTEDTVDEPVMDGADEEFDGDANPRKGQSDPGLIRHPDKNDKTTAPYNL